MDNTAPMPKNTSTANHRRNGQAIRVPGYFTLKTPFSMGLQNTQARQLAIPALQPRDGTGGQRVVILVPVYPPSLNQSGLIGCRRFQIRGQTTMSRALGPSG